MDEGLSSDEIMNTALLDDGSSYVTLNERVPKEHCSHGASTSWTLPRPLLVLLFATIVVLVAGDATTARHTLPTTTTTATADRASVMLARILQEVKKLPGAPPSGYERVDTSYDWCDCETGLSTVTAWPNNDKSQSVQIAANQISTVTFKEPTTKVSWLCDGMGDMQSSELSKASSTWSIRLTGPSIFCILTTQPPFLDSGEEIGDIRDVWRADWQVSIMYSCEPA